ncbi:hypothetical protein Y032_0036g3354 [Ancylostoma ceylanicum]|uniref:Aminotransferase class I/classII large domain-containing protein n=1 Tax=Ancylostoma ceylanicum TaxID=53326 RepID=A0A016UK64_9BILA|nr:hypothetical protein Y032_0036g3354 [Ancylostoma ceylanicum]
MSEHVCFSESGSSLGDWTASDCASLDEICYPAAVEPPHPPSGVDVLLLSTLPAAGVLLAENLVHLPKVAFEDSDMPRRIREQILEVTKTVTVTEIVNAAPDKHPRSCEVTITNLASDTCHPVSVKISHLHERQGVDHSEAQTQTPEVTVEEQTWDAIRRAPDGTTRIEQEQQSKVERIRRKHMPVTTTFNLQTDNVIDLHFTQPVLIEKHDPHERRGPRTAETTTRVGPVHTLYYQKFSDSDGLLDAAGSAADTAAPSATQRRSSVVDEADLRSMASDLTSEGSVIVYADERPRGRASSAEGYFMTFPDSQKKSTKFGKAESDGDVADEWSGDKLASKTRREYIVTSKEETREPDRAPTIRWIYAEFDPSLKHNKADYAKNPRVSRCQMNGETGSAEVLVHSKSEDEQVPGTSKSLPNGHAIFNRTSSSEPKHLRSSTPPPKPARFALTSSRDASESSSFVTNDAFTECSPGVQSDHEAVFGRRRSTPPLMTSTPYTTLERKDRIHMELSSDGRELRQSHSFPTIPLGHDSSFRIKENNARDRGDADDAGDSDALLQPPPTPRRVPSSPIVVVNQSRRGSAELLDGGGTKRHRKPTPVNDIDWFAAFNMKEPSTPKSPGSPFALDVMKEAEVVGEQSHSHQTTSRRSEDEPPKPAEIDIDQVFCVNSSRKGSPKECPCNACYLTKLSDEERARLARASSKPKRVHPVEKNSPQRTSSSNSTPAVDISLDDVFNPGSSSPIHVVGKTGSSSRGGSLGGEKQRDDSGKKADDERTTFYLERAVSATSERNNSDIDLDEIFPLQKAKQPDVKEKLEDTKPSRENFPKREVRAASEPLKQRDSLDWVAALVTAGNQPMDESTRPESAKNGPSSVHNKESRANSAPTTTSASIQDELSQSSAILETKEWLHTLVKYDHPPKEREPAVKKEEKQPAAAEKTIAAVAETSDDLIHKVFEREGSSTDTDARKCPCGACTSDPGSPAPVPKERKRRSAKKQETLEQETRPTSLQRDTATSTTSGKTTDAVPISGNKEISYDVFVRTTSQEAASKPDDDEVEPADDDPDAIHYPPGRATLVGDVLRRPSVLEETSFNTDHLSPISDVSKAYTQRLTQLKSELGLDEMDGGAKEPRDEPPQPQEDGGSSSQPTFYSSEPDSSSEALKHRPMSDEALIDAVFSAVFEGESSEMTSLGAASSSQTLQDSADPPGPQQTGDDAEKRDDASEQKQDSSFDDWYDNPTVPPSEDSEVKDYVNELLNQSMDEAIFSASKSLKDKEEMKQEFLSHTDTSADKKLREQLEPVVATSTGEHVEPVEQKEEKEEKEEKEGAVGGEEEEDPIMKAVFTSSIDKEQLMESVISYPASAASSRMTSSVNTPGPNRTREDSEVFFASDSPAGPAHDGDVTYVSSASVVMNDTHSSSEGDFDEDCIIKLVFSEKKEEAKPSDPGFLKDVPLERVQRTVKPPTVEEARATPDSSANSEVDNRSLSPMESDHHGKADEELLEVEVFQDYFYIKGSYALVINKCDPLGELLAGVHSKGSTSSMDFSITPKLRRLLVQCFKEKARPTIEGADLISSRARNLLTDEDVSDIVYTMMKKNRFNAETNPEGNVNFCTAENNVCTEELMSHLKNKGFSPVESHLIHYPPAGGHKSTKSAVVKYMAEFMSAEVREEDLVILPSSTSGYDMLCHCTCEAEDIVLTSAPTYAASVRNCGSRAECRIRPVEMNMESPKLDVEAYQKTLDDYTVKGGLVRAVLIINPHNPMGAVFPPDDVLKLCNWATRNNLMVLVDESFSSCVFMPDSPFKSFLSYRNRLEKPENVIYLWSLSKDFGIPGLKISVVHSCCPKLNESLATLELIHPVSAVAHDVATAILSDFGELILPINPGKLPEFFRVDDYLINWLRNFHATKLNRLSAHYKFVADHLGQMELPFYPAVAGCFVMIDFRKVCFIFLNF